MAQRPAFHPEESSRSHSPKRDWDLGVAAVHYSGLQARQSAEAPQQTEQRPDLAELHQQAGAAAEC